MAGLVRLAARNAIRNSYNPTEHIKGNTALRDRQNFTKIGKYTYGFKEVDVKRFGSEDLLTIGSFCSIADGVTIYLGGNHRPDWITTFPFGHIFQNRLGGREILGHPASNGAVEIGNDVWLGSGVTIMSGVTIGDGAVVAANSHVVSNVQPYAIVGGNPAKHIKFRFEESIRDLLLELRWWELEDDQIKAIAAQLCSAPTESLLIKLLSEVRD